MSAKGMILNPGVKNGPKTVYDRDGASVEVSGADDNLGFISGMPLTLYPHL